MPQQKELQILSTKQPNWKGVLANAISGQNPATNLLKLARVCQKAQPDMHPDVLSAAWMKHAMDTCKWALSDGAGDIQILEMDDVPDPWRKAVAAIKLAFEIGVDMTKVNSYSNMLKISKMLTKQAAEADAGQAEEEDDDVPILDEEDDVEETGTLRRSVCRSLLHPVGCHNRRNFRS